MRRRLNYVAVGAGSLVVLAIIGFFALRTDSGQNDASTLLTIGGQRLEFPPGYVREKLEDGVLLAAFFPDFRPAAGARDITATTNLDERFLRQVFLTLKPADPLLDPSDRMARLYQRFLTESVSEGPANLLRRNFEPGSPFEADEFFYLPPEGRAFAARCRRSEVPQRTPASCVATQRLGALDVEVRFAEAHLADWEMLMARAHDLVEAARR